MRTVNQFGNLEEMRNLLIKVDGGVPVRLRDVAEVRGRKEREGIVRVGGHEAIELAVYKEGDANTVSVAGAVKKQLERLKTILPTNAKLDTIDDQSIFIQSSLDDVRNDAIIGGVLAVLIIFFFLADSWSTFIISLSLPVSLIATFFFMGQAGVSLNVMSLGGLALATGMVVDIRLSCSRTSPGASRAWHRRSRVKGAREVSMAVIASTRPRSPSLPPRVRAGVAGQLFRDQALTVTFAMLISLVVAMTLIPMLASLKGRSPIAYKDEEPSPGWQPTSAFGRVVKKIITPVSRLFFRWIPLVFMRVGFIVFGVIGKAVGKVLRAIGRVVLMPYNAAARAHRAFPAKGASRVRRPCWDGRRRARCEHRPDSDAGPT